MEIAITLATLACSYILGSIPTGYWIARSKGIDIRQQGSGSTGATNVLRCVGKKEAAIVLAVDILKGYAPVAGALILEQNNMLGAMSNAPYTVAVLAALLSILGHSKSIFLGFTGGKSAATGLGTLLGLNPAAGALTLATWLLVLGISKIVSLASISAAAMCPVFMFLLKAPAAILGYGVIAFLYVALRHKSNIRRLLDGSEPRIGQKASAGADDATTPDDQPSGETGINTSDLKSEETK